MSSIPVCGIQPAVLRWARESIELSLDDVAQHLKCAPEQVQAWEQGESVPNYAQLEKLAYSCYKRPLAVFFLPQVPQETPVVKEFRTLPESTMERLYPDTIVHIRKAKAFQLELESLYQGRNHAAQLITKQIKLDIASDVVVQAQRIRDFLALPLDIQITWKNDDQALKEWRKAIELVGCFVFKSSFKQKEISGFCLPHAELPIIYLNNSTTKTRQIFSLLHELAHLGLEVHGLSRLDSEYINELPPEIARVERFCNSLAAEILIPMADLMQRCTAWKGSIDAIDENSIVELAKRYGVSREAVFRRLLDLGYVSQSLYERKAQTWASQKKEGSGGDWFASQNSYLSPAFAQEVASRHFQNLISSEEAASMLGVHPKNYEELEHRILQGALA